MPVRRSYKSGRAYGGRRSSTYSRSRAGRTKTVRRSRTYGGRSKRRKALFSTRFGRKISGGLRSRMRYRKNGSVSQRVYSGGAGKWTGANSARFFKSRHGRPSNGPFFESAVLATRGPYVPKRSRAPFDIYYHVSTTGPFELEPNLGTIAISSGPLDGLHLGNIFTNIQAESPYTLTGGTYVLRPNLHIDWEWCVTVSNHGGSDLYCEIVPFGSRQTATLSTTTQFTNFINQYAQNFDVRPTGYEFWPQTSLLMNQYAWKEKLINLAARRVKIGVDKTMKFKWKSRKTKHIRWPDITEASLLTTGGMIAGKSLRAMIKVCTQLGQVCGVLAAANQPTQATVGGDCIINSQVIYRYRYSNDNAAPSVYAANTTAASGNLPVGYTVAATAQTWMGVPSQKATRAVNNATIHNASTVFGGLDAQSKPEANINPVADCASDPLVPEVATAP